MVANTRASASGGGDPRRVAADHERRIGKLERASSLRGASISGGKPLTVRDGGNIVVEGGGNILVTDEDGNVLFDALKSTETTVARSASGSHAMTADATWRESPQATIHIGIPAGFDHMVAVIAGHAGHSVTGPGNSWIGSTANAWFLDADGNIVPPIVAETSGDVSDAYCPFHSGGGPAAPTYAGSVQAAIPLGATRVKVSTFYSIALSGQVMGAGDGNTSVNVMVTFGHRQ